MERTIEQALSELITGLPVGETTRDTCGGYSRSLGVGFTLEYCPESEDHPALWVGEIYNSKFHDCSLVKVIDDLKNHHEYVNETYD